MDPIDHSYDSDAGSNELTIHATDGPKEMYAGVGRSLVNIHREIRTAICRLMDEGLGDRFYRICSRHAPLVSLQIIYNDIRTPKGTRVKIEGGEEKRPNKKRQLEGPETPPPKKVATGAARNQPSTSGHKSGVPMIYID